MLELFRKREITEEERVFRLEQGLSGMEPFSNGAVWDTIVLKFAKQNRRLTQEEVSAVLNTLKSDRALLDGSVSDVFNAAGVADFGKDKLLSSVAFNYDYEIDGQERRDKAISEFESGTLKKEIGWMQNPEFMTLEDHVRRDMHYADIRARNIFDSSINAPRIIYASQDDHGSFGIDDSLWTRDIATRSVFTRDVLPYLKHDELIKASKSLSQVRPTIIQRGINS